MNFIDVFRDENLQKQKDKIYGVAVAIVTNNQDPDGLGRIKVKFPWLSDGNESNWARIATPMAGNERGFYFIPEVDDEVLVAFEHGDIGLPYIIGCLWNGADKPPEETNDGNNIRTIRSRSGHVIRLNDEDGNEKIEIIDKSENNSIVIDTATNTLTITSDQDITLLAEKGKIKLSAKEIEVKSSEDTLIEATGDNIIKGSLVDINPS